MLYKYKNKRINSDGELVEGARDDRKQVFLFCGSKNNFSLAFGLEGTEEQRYSAFSDAVKQMVIRKSGSAKK